MEGNKFEIDGKWSAEELAMIEIIRANPQSPEAREALGRWIDKEQSKSGDMSVEGQLAYQLRYGELCASAECWEGAIDSFESLRRQAFREGNEAQYQFATAKLQELANILSEDQYNQIIDEVCARLDEMNAD